MKFFLIFAATLLAVNALTEKQHWESFKVKYNKTYLNVAEETKRFQVFQENVKKINEHNERYEAGEETYSMAVNKFADMSEEEFGAMLRLKNGARPNVEGEMHVQVGSAPDSIDWRTKGAVLGVKNQLECGSCWAFSATGALEGQNAILKNKKVALSEQQLLDCSYGSTYGNGDCDQGGDMVAAFKYVKDHGLNSEAEYPYVGALKSCRAKSDSQVKVTGYKSIQRSEAALKQAVGTVGPISAAIYADPIQFYSSGIFNNYKCVSSYDKIDHGVLAVGYGTSPSDYWIIKNSWGADWGEHGFFRLARDHNMCGIQLDTSYPIIA